MDCLLNEEYACHLGEGIAAGLPAYLVRFAGCNLSCSYCDTRYACEEAGRPVPVAAIVTRAQASRLGTVLVTGGEPLLQEAALVELTRALHEAGLAVVLETNGTRPLDGIPDFVEKVVDLKTPGAAAGEPFCATNLEALGPRDQLKVVLTCRKDFDWAVSFLAAHPLPIAPGLVLFSPAMPGVEPGDLSRWLLEARLPYRFHLQQHKFVWGDRRGV